MSQFVSSHDLLISYLNKEDNMIKWDRIILSVSDVNQAEYNKGLLLKKYGNELKLESGALINVIEDPYYLKKGNGGVIIYILRKLVEDFTEEVIFREKILLILSGGYSKRFPIGSVMGKIFTNLPSKLCSNLCMWDIKLAHTSPFSQQAPPGLFVTCADDIEPYIVEHDFASRIKFGPHFTALAHPCGDFTLASQHGVYVTEVSNDTACLQVLQKPTVEELHQILNTGDRSTFIDSAFFFTHEVSRSLLNWSRVTDGWYSLELDAYGDFLTSLNTWQKENQSRNSSTDTKSTLLNLLRRFSLDLIILRDSYFIHLGTTAEFLENITNNLDFMKEIGCINSSSNKHLNIVCSKLSGSSSVSPYSFVEYCDIQCDIEIGDKVILSHCFCLPGPKLCIPARTMIQTIPIFHPVSRSDAYVTILFGIDDDLKTPISSETLAEIRYLNRPLSSYKFFSNCDVKFTYSLWSAKLFPVFNDPETSFRFAVKVSQSLSLYENECFKNTGDIFVSMEDIIRLKHTDKLIAMHIDNIHN